ncbi:uncharacterized protein ACO6RY_06722 [Pungitius sinensis]
MLPDKKRDVLVFFGSSAWVLFFFAVGTKQSNEMALSQSSSACKQWASLSHSVNKCAALRLIPAVESCTVFSLS